MLASSSFKQLRTFVIVPDVLIKFSRIRNVFFSDVVYDVSISWNYILLSLTDNFGLGKWAKIERNDDKLLRVKTSLVDSRVYTWEKWDSKTIRPNRMGISYKYIFSRSRQIWLLSPLFFPNFSTTSNKRRKLKRQVIFNSCLNLLFFRIFSFWLFFFTIVLWLEVHSVFF